MIDLKDGSGKVIFTGTRDEAELTLSSQTLAKPTVVCSGYDLAYPKASKFMENADGRLQEIIDKLTVDERESLRDRFADFYVAVTDQCI